jgi:hypothetical protein
MKYGLGTGKDVGLRSETAPLRAACRDLWRFDVLEKENICQGCSQGYCCDDLEYIHQCREDMARLGLR